MSLLDTAVTSRYGIPVTRPGRTIIDLARVEPPEVIRQARREAEFRNLPLDDLGRSDRTRSDLEDEFLALVRRAGLPEPKVAEPKVGLRIGPYTVDFAWPAQRLVVETDGYRAHRGRQAFHDDRVRDAHLARLGYRVQRFSDWQIDHEPTEVIATVHALLGVERGGR